MKISLIKRYKNNSKLYIMSYFLLPRVNFDIKPSNIKLKFDEKLEIKINKSLAK